MTTNICPYCNHPSLDQHGLCNNTDCSTNPRAQIIEFPNKPIDEGKWLIEETEGGIRLKAIDDAHFREDCYITITREGVQVKSITIDVESILRREDDSRHKN